MRRSSELTQKCWRDLRGRGGTIRLDVEAVTLRFCDAELDLDSVSNSESLSSSFTVESSLEFYPSNCTQKRTSSIVASLGTDLGGEETACVNDGEPDNGFYVTKQQQIPP